VTGTATNVVRVETSITGLVGLPDGLLTASTVFLPDPARLPATPVVLFGFPGAGYGRGYFSFDLPGSSYGGQAGYHVEREGWIVVACDHLGVGESSTGCRRDLTLDHVALANRQTVEHVTALLASGTLDPDFPAVPEPVRIGVGQSMGGGLTIHLQGRWPVFDAVAVLGFSARHVPMPSDDRPGGLSAEETWADPEARERSLRAVFHRPDVPSAVVERDMTAFPTRRGDLPEWGSATMPGCVVEMPRPGVVSAQAAAIDVPVFIGVGEVDVVPDPRAEPSAYSGSADITLVVVPDMAHMHNFASSRTHLWDRLGAWGTHLGRS